MYLDDYYSKINVVGYDTDYHVPQSIHYLFEVPEKSAVDENFYHEINNFKILVN